MRNKTIIYKQKVNNNLNESIKHFEKLNVALSQLQKKYKFPLSRQEFDKILITIEDIAFSDQIIYRFSKLQDCMGAKLFKSILLYQGENVNKPFLDILNQLETINILNVDKWFEIRDLRNEIAHDYDENDNNSLNILNAIYKSISELNKILLSIENLIK